MYRVFSMDESGRLYQLSSQGWNKGFGASFPDLQRLRAMIVCTGLPALPNGQLMQDTYIAAVGAAGLILRTFPLTPAMAGKAV
jgi:hypothetical protein